MSTPSEQTQATLKAEIERLQAEIKHLKATSQQKVKARDALIHDIYNSSSWRFARPLRALKKAIDLLRKNQPAKKTGPASNKITDLPQKKGNNDKLWPKVSEVEALTLLSGSPLFDANWYRNQYPDVAKSGLDPALHYIRRGGPAKRKPSIYFDPVYYLDQNPTIVRSGISPLVHYLKYGQAEGKKPLALLEVLQTEAPRPLNNSNMPIIASPGIEFSDALPWVRHNDLATTEGNEGLFYGDVLLALLSPVETMPDMLAPLFAFCRLLDVDTGVHVRVSGAAGNLAVHDRSPLWAGIMLQRYRGFGPGFVAGPARIADAWFANDSTLRLRFGEDGTEAPDTERYVVRAFQADAAVPEKIALVGEVLLPEMGPAVADLNLSSPLLPVLLILSTPDGTIVDMGILPFPSLCRGGMHHAELSYLGVEGNPVEDLRLISDALVQEYVSPDDETSRSIQQVAVALEVATGAERIFSDSVREWLARVFRLGIVSNVGQSEAAHHGIKYLHDLLHTGEGIRPSLLNRVTQDIEEGSTLLLSPEALPTISALVSRRLRSPRGSANVAGAFIVADKITCRPRWSVVLPPMDEDLLVLQPSISATRYPVLISSEVSPIIGQDSGTRSVADLPLAVHYRGDTSSDEASMLMPLAPDSAKPTLRRVLTPMERTQAGVTAIVRCMSVVGTKRLLQSLAQQTFSDNIDVIAVIEPDLDTAPDVCRSELERLFNGRHSVFLSSGSRRADFRQIADGLRGHFTLFVDDTIVLHDPRTIETLATLAHGNAVASASCVILHEPMVQKRSVVQYQSGGFFPLHVSFQSAPHLIFNQPNWLEVFADATYPVVGNSFELDMIRTDILRQYWATEPAAFSEAYEPLHFALKTIEHGHRHLCTSAVRATSFAGATSQDRMDPIGRNFIKPQQWENLLSSVTLLRELR